MKKKRKWERDFLIKIKVKFLYNGCKVYVIWLLWCIYIYLYSYEAYKFTRFLIVALKFSY